MPDFTKLKVWQKAHAFTINLYKISSTFPSEEKFGLTNQIRRGSVSIESNLAEGAGRSISKDFSRFLDIAQGSAFEVKCKKSIPIEQSDLDFRFWNGYASKVESASWFSMSVSSPQNKSWSKISCLSSTASLLGFTDFINTKNKSPKRSKKKPPNPTKKLTPNSVEDQGVSI
jgi:four helix bundle protein